ncbi:hypothetical protein [Nannocystis sp.]|uniref:hypothetical protein n=1 Tax=Nannocystis sp. TaxID=1962667 RepID=UPI002423A2BE|nr:hypothetical protein [Nannocystis sp.]MBK7825315.1 hypothetical protein [Nannocystis sp.]MBK9756824.1 hypothetical protein [Nannocystis sp.]
MSHRSKASSLPERLLLAAVLAACGHEDSDSESTTTAATTSSSSAATPTTTNTTTEAATTTTAESTSGAADTTAATTHTSSTGDAVHCDNMLTWENFGEAFMLSWCTGCHSSALPTADRAGAPCAVNFDAHAGVVPFAASIEVRAIDWQKYDSKPMPPAAIVPDDELALLREWIDCGAPGPDTGQPPPKCPDP